MSTPLTAPAASDPPEHQADWLELLALSKDDKNSSLEDLVRELRRSGSTEAVGEPESIEEITDEGSERSQAIAEDAFAELHDRSVACGGHPVGYPFDVFERYIQGKSGSQKSIYTFLLLLSQFGKDAGPPGLDAADLFERVSAVAALEYFGGSASGARAYPFGFPRRLTPRGFKDALDDLCREMGEGGGCREWPTRHDQKDGHLDLAVWRPFPDRRGGKLIGFGQCATGKDWFSGGKLHELQPATFCASWMHVRPLVEPVRLFFIPFRAELAKWNLVGYAGGIVFDRCRISELARDIDAEVLKSCEAWCEHVLGALT